MHDGWGYTDSVGGRDRQLSGTMKIAVSVEPCLDGHTNMARDAVLLDRAERGGAHARVYTWDGAWVSLGRFQRPEKALRDPGAIDWVMRPTGGKAVLHGHDVTVCMAVPLHALGITESGSRRVSTVYRAVVRPLVEALTAAGLPATLAENTQFVRTAGQTADCFAHVSPTDIVDPGTGHKVCGCALRVTQGAVLVQASVPVLRPLVRPDAIFDSAHTFVTERELKLERLASELKSVRLGPVPAGA